MKWVLIAVNPQKKADHRVLAGKWVEGDQNRCVEIRGLSGALWKALAFRDEAEALHFRRSLLSPSTGLWERSKKTDPDQSVRWLLVPFPVRDEDLKKRVRVKALARQEVMPWSE